MPYSDRLQTAEYVAPSGRSITFDFEAISRDISHRIGTFEFSGVNGTLHQDKGVSGELYPLTVYVHGPDYDLEADRFIELSRETGDGLLIHPRWGRRRVQILSITQAENLVNRGGQAVFNVQFQETLEREFPRVGTSAAQQVTASADAWQVTAITNFTDQVDTPDLPSELSLEQNMVASANAVDAALSSVASASQDVATQFRGFIDDIVNNAAEYVQVPFEYASRITSAVRVVTEIPGRISSRLQGLNSLLNAVLLREIVTPTIDLRNALLIDEIVGTSVITAASEAINQALSNASAISRDSNGRATITVPGAEEGFQTRSEVLAAIVYIQDSTAALVDQLDIRQSVFENTTISESYLQSVQSYEPARRVASEVINAALALSFSLPVKRAVTLDAADTIIGLSYRFYGNIDDVTLDYFIQTNSLTGSEIIEVPMGREVIFYE